VDAVNDAALELKRIRDEAAGWYARLNKTTISHETLRAFREWRSDERHAEAYAEIDAFWRRIGKLRQDEEIQRAAGEALGRADARKGYMPRPGGKTLSAAAFAVLLAVGTAVAWPYVFGRTFETAPAEQRLIHLADGSRLRLDADSRARVRLGAARRDVELLAGRAYFDVAPDPERPFVVSADGASVRALGTRFAVGREGSAIEVTLVEGKVRVEAQGGAETLTLAPGEQVRIAGPAATPRRARVDAQAETSWTTGRLVFRDQPLAAAVAEVNRYGEARIVLADPDLAGRRVSGVFDTGDTEAFVGAVSALYGLKAERDGRQIRLAPAT
jgi:transmembrane sensor